MFRGSERRKYLYAVVKKPDRAQTKRSHMKVICDIGLYVKDTTCRTRFLF